VDRPRAAVKKAIATGREYLSDVLIIVAALAVVIAQRKCVGNLEIVQEINQNVRGDPFRVLTELSPVMTMRSGWTLEISSSMTVRALRIQMVTALKWMSVN
jgi:hypothetical protein